MIICSHSNIDIIQGVIGYGDTEGITDWRFTNTNDGILNILNSTSADIRLSILENGNVGIGTTNPSSILDIIGDANITGVYKKNNRDVINDTSNYVLSASNILVPRILTEVGNGSNYVSRLNTALNTSVDNTSNYILSNSINSQWNNVSSGIHYNTSNVGIGTTNPVNKLHIYDNSINNTKLIIQNKTTATINTTIPTEIIVAETTSTSIGNTDRIIMFPYSGTGATKDYTFTTTEVLVCDILIVGGGGGGGGGHGGGGGAGQLVLVHQATLNGTYTVKVGKGGVRGTNPASGGVEPTKGSNSSFDYVIAEGGGANGGNTSKDGGSGAGGDSWLNGLGVKGKGLKNTTVDTYSSGTVYSRGNDGGEGGTDPGQGAGGGGAGTSGGAGANSYTNGGPGNGGDGLSGISAISYDFKTNFGNYGKLETDGNYWFAGGGGGGGWNQPVVAIGGKGGGGNGGSGLNNGVDSGKDATNNTGSGGGGGSGNYGSGANGGSGIVIIKYRRLGMIVAGTTSTTIGTTNRIIMFPYSGTGSTKNYTCATTEALDCDILIVGGGGGGGAGHGGGGGAGQLILIHQATLNGTYTIKVGKGGDGAILSGSTLISAATKGVNSEFGNATINVIAEGGGANGGSTLKDGGSGSGGDGHTPDSGVAGKGLKNTTVDTFSSGTVYSRGNDGGDGGVVGQGGGGGGAGTAGTTGGNNAGTTIGHGGDGLSGISAISYDFKTNFGNYGKLETDGNYWFAGGGAGGIYNNTNGVVSNGGKGGGGSTPPNVINTPIKGGNGMNGTGGGGAGGSAHYGSGGNGGSGIVIIKIKNIIHTSSTIDLIRGVPGDANTDYSITNYEGDFKIISSTSSVNTDYIKITSDGASIYNPTGSPQWSTVSDRRIKENIEKASYDKCYDNINKLELYRFNYIAELKNINKDLKQLGYIAQEVQDIFPKAVSSQEFHNDNLSIPDMLSIDIAQINYSLYGAVKKLMEMCTNKKSRLKKLEYLFETASNIAIQDTSMLI